ncbi:hypothetical protein KGM_208177 [Danaus plexippus plexippus]|uniref:Uncharacterized protein n=1 Tax=Danaus plexippus plexippus TaxID=278856 RepID=A0A212EUH9_DANPL|nr:hypothetical protein KGM_208177 [Danaus plexippus plexippus]
MPIKSVNFLPSEISIDVSQLLKFWITDEVDGYWIPDKFPEGLISWSRSGHVEDYKKTINQQSIENTTIKIVKKSPMPPLIGFSDNSIASFELIKSVN